MKFPNEGTMLINLTNLIPIYYEVFNIIVRTRYDIDKNYISNMSRYILNFNYNDLSYDAFIGDKRTQYRIFVNILKMSRNIVQFYVLYIYFNIIQ